MAYPTNDLSQILKILAASQNAQPQPQPQQGQGHTPDPQFQQFQHWQPPPASAPPPQQVQLPPYDFQWNNPIPVSQPQIQPQIQPQHQHQPQLQLSQLLEQQHPAPPPPQALLVRPSSSAPAPDPRLSNPHYTPHPPPPPRPVQSRPEPFLITTLAAARRYIVHHLSTSQSFLSQLARLKSRQHALEREWAASRADILRRHAERAANSLKLSGILAGLGVVPGKAGDGALMDKDEELRVFDRKVMRRAEEMVETIAEELKTMGVPLFVRGGNRPEGVGEKEWEGWKGEVLGLLEDLAEEEQR
ncbi:hypothetical protein EDC01DRAFT_751608 [Geopyxis carbonaria]|nr:hypothetical protein EDC01DRAFT_751608 [Geopyxis carbonaria]